MRKILPPSQAALAFRDACRENAGLDETQIQDLEPIIRYTLPSWRTEPVELGWQAFQAAYPEAITGDNARAVTIVLEHLKMQTRTVSYGTSHPVASGIRRLTKRLNQHNVTDESRRSVFRFFLSTCETAWDHESKMTGLYSEHVRSLRDAMTFVIETTGLRTKLASELPAGILAALYDELSDGPEEKPLPYPKGSVSNVRKKLVTTYEVLSEQRPLGVPTITRERRTKWRAPNAGDHVQGEPGPDGDRQEGEDSPLKFTLSSHGQNDPAPRPKRPQSKSLAGKLDREDRGDPATDVVMIQPQHIQKNERLNPDQRADSSDVESVDIALPAEFTVSERRRCYADLIHVQAGRNCASRSDMQRHSLRQLSTWLEFLAAEDSVCALGVFLVWSLGLSPTRLERLTISSNRLCDDRPHLDPERNRLSYQITNSGAASAGSVEDQTAENHLMMVTLPTAIVERIVTIENGECPLLDLQTRYKVAKKRIENASGVRICTLTQWRASSHAFDAERFNALEAAAKGGETGFNEKAASAYRQLSRTEVGAELQARWAALAEYWRGQNLMKARASIWLSDLRVTEPLPQGVIGSIRYAPADELAPLVQAIRREIKTRHQRLNGRFSHKNLDTLIELVNLQQLNFNIIFQLHSLGRPLSQKTELAIDEQGLWVSDKASRQYRERKLIPTVTPEEVRHGRGLLLEQQAAGRDTWVALENLLPSLSISFEVNNVNLAEPVPGFVQYDPARGLIELHRMTPARLDQCLDALQLASLWPGAKNLFRHLASTELSKNFDDALTDEALGHKRPGKDFFGPESSGSLSQLASLADAVTAWATRMKLTAVQINTVVWAGIYDQH